jgi:RNA polymerase sigma-70 factor (ECF subfamily)
MTVLPATSVLPAAATSAQPVDRLVRLVDKHYDRLYRLARRLSATADDARDLVQETFLRAARSAATIPCDLTGEEAWLVRVLVNTRRDEWRKAGVRARHRAAAARETGTWQSAEPALVARATVWRALDSLSPRRRAVVVMREIEGLSVRAISQLLGVTPITVRWHLAMARKDLLRILAPGGTQ